MKKIHFLLIVICFGFLFLDDVSATTMKYIIEGNPTYYFVIDKNNIDSTYTGDGKKYIITDFQFPEIAEHNIHDIEKIYFTDKNSQVNTTSPNAWWSYLYGCSYEENIVFNIGSWASIDIIAESSELPEENRHWFWEWIISGEGVECNKFVPERELSADETVDQCFYYDQEFISFTDLLKDYEKKDSTSKMDIVKNYEQKLKKLKVFCNDVLSKLDYEDACVRRCIKNLKKDVAVWDEKVGKKISKINECGLSGKLILFIANIVKWLKYIIPVIVIVLGILDFIQAIAADKDDMMKKAQGRFVKRLIAAALIFIIPFLIEFVLDKMGFGVNGCGIIDL